MFNFIKVFFLYMILICVLVLTALISLNNIYEINYFEKQTLKLNPKINDEKLLYIFSNLKYKNGLEIKNIKILQAVKVKITEVTNSTIFVTSDNEILKNEMSSPFSKANITRQMTYEINRKTGELTSFKILGNSTEYDAIVYKDIKNIRHEFIWQLFKDEAPFEVETKTVIEKFFKILKISFTAESIKDDIAVLRSQTDENQTADILMGIDIKTSKIKEIAVVHEEILNSEKNNDTKLTTSLFISENFDEVYSHYIKDSLQPKADSYDLQKMEKPQLDENFSAEEIFISQKGIIDVGDIIKLSYVKNFSPVSQYYFKFSNLTVYDEFDKNLNIKFIPLILEMPNELFFAPVIKPTENIILNTIKKAKAKVMLYKSNIEEVEVMLNASTNITKYGVNIELLPQKVANTYQLIVKNSDSSYFLPSLITADATATIKLLKADNNTKIYKLFFDDDVLKIKLYINTGASKYLYEKEIDFIFQSEYEKDLNLPPVDKFLITFPFKSGHEDIEKVGGGNIHNLYFLIPRDIADSCTFEILNVEKVTDQKLYMKKDDFDSFGLYDFNFQRYTLATTDNITEFFYNNSIEIALKCYKNIQTKTIDYDFASRPWIVDLDKLPEFNYSKEMVLHELLSNFIFIDKYGQEVMPTVNADEEVSRLFFLEDPYELEYFLQDKHYLKMPTSLKSIQKKYLIDSDFYKIWDIEFDKISLHEEIKVNHKANDKREINGTLDENGTKNGVFSEQTNEKCVCKGEYKNGQKVGYWSCKSIKNGQLLNTYFYNENGNLEGEASSFEESGFLYLIANYKDGYRSGESVHFDRSGAKTTSLYANGTLVVQKTYDEILF